MKVSPTVAWAVKLQATSYIERSKGRWPYMGPRTVDGALLADGEYLIAPPIGSIPTDLVVTRLDVVEINKSVPLRLVLLLFFPLRQLKLVFYLLNPSKN